MQDSNSRLVYSTDPHLNSKIDDEEKSIPKRVNLTPEKQNVKIFLQTKGRKGKQVTVIQGFQHDQNSMDNLARELKRFCGCGGTVKDLEIEIQGDKRQAIEKKLSQLGYRTRVI